MPLAAVQEPAGTESMKSRSFRKDQAGAFIPAFALSVLAVTLSAGIAVDYSRLSRAQSIMNNSLDAAILATGNRILEGEKSKRALRIEFENFLEANLASNPDIGDVTTIENFKVYTKTGRIDATLNAPVQMAFMGLVGKPVVDVASKGQAVFSTNSVEIAMMLDVTGSMRSDKLESLKLAAKDAVDILLPEGKNNGRIRVGLVPYSAGVNVSPEQAERASGQKERTCMTERKDHKASDASYTIEPVGSDDLARCSDSKVSPLTDKSSTLKSDIDALVAEGSTAGHLGIAWTYYMLSDNWKGVWPAKGQPNAYSANTQKIAILMTDGEFNTYFQGVNENHYSGQKTRSDRDSIALCNHMKRAKAGGMGITVYSVVFQTGNNEVSVSDTLRKCASKGKGKASKYFVASNEVELREAFKKIATDIKKLRLTK